MKKLTFKVENFYNKNQFIITNGEKTIFQSYQSVCAIFDGEKLILGRDWDYSHTTIRHLYRFLLDYVGLSDLSTKVIRKAINQGTIGNGYRNYKLIYDGDLK